MPRVKRGTQHVKRRRTLLAKTKGYKWGRKSKIKLARIASIKAGAYAYRDRRNKKRSFRRLWQIRLNAALREHGISYAVFMGAVEKANIALDRKILSTLAMTKPAVFSKIIERVKA